MVSIQFQKNASYHLATESGRAKEIKIPAGTVQRDLTDAQAERWVRRGVAVRIPDDLTPAIPPAPPPAPAPAPVDTVEPVAPAAPPPPPPPPAGSIAERFRSAVEGNGST